MEELLVTAVGYLKLAVEAVGAAIVGFGAPQRSPSLHKPEIRRGPGRSSSGPCILSAVVESTGRARQTGSGPGPKRPQEAVRSSRPSFGKESPNSCQGLSETNTERARIRKDGPQDQGGATYGP